jgi:hypothetical protein
MLILKKWRERLNIGVFAILGRAKLIKMAGTETIFDDDSAIHYNLRIYISR